MFSFPISIVRISCGALLLFSAAALGQELWLVSPVGFGPGQRAMSGAALVSNKGALALASNPAEVASLRGLSVYASGDFSLSSLKLHEANTKYRFLARPQLAAAWRLPEGFAVGLAWGRGELSAIESKAAGVSWRPVPLHRMLSNLAWELIPGFRLGAALQLATTENASWTPGAETGAESWRGGRWAVATRAGLSVEVAPKRCTLALTWEEGLSLSSRRAWEAFGKLKTPHSLALAVWLGEAGSWEFEANLVYGWQRPQADAARKAQAKEDIFGARAGMGLWLTPVIQLRAGGAVFSHSPPAQPSWVQPMDAWSSSLSAGALWRYGPMHAEVAWQMLAGFESSKNPHPWVKQRISNLLSLGVGWNFH